MYYAQIQQAGTIINLRDNTGNTVATFAPKKEYRSIAISSPELKKDSAYTLYTAGTSTGSNTDGLYTDGEYKGGTKVVDLTISKSVTWMSETGETESRALVQEVPMILELEEDQNELEMVHLHLQRISNSSGQEYILAW